MEINLTLEKLLGNAFEKITGWLEGLFKMLPNLILAIVIVILAWVLAAVTAKIVERAMRRLSTHEEVRSLFVRICHLGVISGGIAVALGVLDLNKTVTSLLAGVGILGLALGFAFKDIASNFMAGILLTFHHQFTVGDLIKTSDFFGWVEAINLRATVGRALQGQMVVIPNSQLLTKPIVNYSAKSERRVDLSCGVAYGDDLQKVEEITIETVTALEERLTTRPVEFYYEEFGSSSINFNVRFWTRADQKTYLKARSKAIKAIKKAFDENRITIPFPIRTLDFGVVGGETLAEHLEALQLSHNEDAPGARTGPTK